ncbi:3-octaprenyl-4-hydroxybenzoate carboxy-lyase [Striga asiatica]|uniref:3-octaprenyl-4-hydroxybenzoate carboxy-lyase n=1 Tax=Striga asiatica TaxID=4170 RepID=A0A5A7R5C1_STRAF|nr:3-octaprenyl-4-hydroxybenzoate carboxy-lyase [Striga asiatica]
MAWAREPVFMGKISENSCHLVIIGGQEAGIEQRVESFHIAVHTHGQNPVKQVYGVSDQAAPAIEDDEVRDQVFGFAGAEAVHGVPEQGPDGVVVVRVPEFGNGFGVNSAVELQLGGEVGGAEDVGDAGRVGLGQDDAEGGVGLVLVGELGSGGGEVEKKRRRWRRSSVPF